MEIDNKTFVNEYIQEARENLDVLWDLSLQVNKNNRDSNCLKEILRILHTLKGSSRMLGFHKIEKIIHGTENVFKLIQNNQTEIPAQINQLLISIIKVIRKSINYLERSGIEQIENFDFVNKNIEFASEGVDFSTDFFESDTVGSAEDSITTDENIYDNQAIKISVNQINTILQSFDKMIINQIKLKKLVSSYNNWELQEIMEILETQTFGIQEQIISLRMLPLDMVLQPIKRSIATEQINLGKNVQLDIPHSDITIDKAILEKLPKILIHLVRNSLDHGIESPEIRKALGKNEQGLISITVSQSSNRIFITVSDDGSGIDYEKIRTKALRLFPSREKEISQMDNNNMIQFLFVSGFSTKETVSELSGRGVGLDVVRSEMDKLKGKINVTSVKGQGTSFELSLPTSLATQDGLFVREGQHSYLILSHYIREIITVSKDNFIHLQHGPVLTLHDELIPVYDFDIITGNIESSVRTDKMNASVVVIEYLNRKIAVIADEILHYNTVVIKPLPPIMKKFNAIQGVIFDENYSIIPVLNIPYCMNKFKAANVFEIKNLEVNKQKKIYSVLIADDSHTTRHIEQIILEAEGYRVTTACDGIEALELLKTYHFDIVVTDVRMPRMDGFVLIHNMRHTAELENIPVIVVSSVFENDTKEKVDLLGAQAYIVKSDFERENLVAKVKELLGSE